MTTKRFVTNRVLKNKVTGIDIFVPDFEESAGLMSSSAIYNVIVITRLFYYKTHQHKESDVVQFMVQRKFEEFETLYHKLSERFPSVLFPALPKRALITNTSVIQERKIVMNNVLQLVAKTQKLCCSPMVLQFLGVQGPQGKAQQIQEKKESNPDVKEETTVIKTGVREDSEDLFVPETNKDKPTFSAGKKSFSEDEKLLMDDPGHTVPENFSTQAKLSIFENENGDEEKGEDELFLPNNHVKEAILSEDLDVQDSLDLLDVNDDVDDLLSLSKKSEIKQIVKSKPTPKPKPSLKSKTPERTSFQAGTEEDELFTKQNKETEKELWTEGSEQKEDLFFKARKQSLRKNKTSEKSLDDIFTKKSATGLFTKGEEEDLFSTKPENVKPEEEQDVQTMDENDISKYISQNLENPDDAQLDLGL